MRDHHLSRIHISFLWMVFRWSAPKISGWIKTKHIQTSFPHQNSSRKNHWSSPAEKKNVPSALICFYLPLFFTTFRRCAKRKQLHFRGIFFWKKKKPMNHLGELPYLGDLLVGWLETNPKIFPKVGLFSWRLTMVESIKKSPTKNKKKSSSHHKKKSRIRIRLPSFTQNFEIGASRIISHDHRGEPSDGFLRKRWMSSMSFAWKKVSISRVFSACSRQPVEIKQKLDVNLFHPKAFKTFSPEKAWNSCLHLP